MLAHITISHSCFEACLLFAVSVWWWLTLLFLVDVREYLPWPSFPAQDKFRFVHIERHFLFEIVSVRFVWCRFDMNY
ncbi:hypothetical protein BDZ45DRAFT_101336 [Acephala macrosclerotiorum]|nr:hypothetical protein BDZ45DRAFT_101336 [Acephala macrosclerotiorum]